MLIATIILAAFTGLGIAGTLVKTVYNSGKQSGEITEALKEITKTLTGVTNTVSSINTTLNEHAARLERLERK